MKKLGIIFLIIGIALVGYGSYQTLTYKTIRCTTSVSFIKMDTYFKFKRKTDKLISLGYKMKIAVPDILDADQYERELSDSCSAYDNCKIFRLGNTITISYDINDPDLINDTIDLDDGTAKDLTYDNLLEYFDNEGLTCK